MQELVETGRPDPLTGSANSARPHEAATDDAAPTSRASSEPNLNVQRWLRRGAAAGVGFTLLVAGVVLTGWLFDVAGLQTLVPGLDPMKTNTALALVLLAGALVLRLRRPDDRGADAAVALQCAVAIAIGIATLLEDLGHWDLRIDELFAPERNPAPGVLHPGRISPITAVILVLLGSAILLMDSRARRGRRSAEGLAIGAGFASLAAMFGYLYGAPNLYQVGDLIAIALPTAVLCHVMALSILVARPDRGLARIVASNGAGGAMVRRVMPAVVALPIIGWLSLIGQQRGLYGTEMGLAVMATSAAVVLFAVVWRSAWWLYGVDAERTALVQELDHRVESRTRELTASVDELHEATQRFEHAFADAPIGMALVGPDGHYVHANAAFCHLLGYRESDLLDRTFVDVTHPDDVTDDVERHEQLLAGEIQHYEIEKRYRHALGHDVWAQTTVSLVRDAAGEPSHFITQIQDITARRRAKAVADEANVMLNESIDRLERSHREISLINDMTEFLQACVGPEEIREVVERFLQELLAGGSGTLALVGLANSHLERIAAWGPPVNTPVSFSPDDCWALRRGRPHLVEAGSTAPRCRHLETPTSATPTTATPTSETTLCMPLTAQGEALGVLTWQVGEGPSNDQCAIHTEEGRALAVAVAGHISLAVANLNLRESLRAQSIRDPLTELFNRRYMEESLDRELARATRNKASLGIIAIDVDHFKLFNDVHGHAAGDAVLQAVGRVLEAGIRQEDIACRSGGEEFVLILPDASLEITAGRAERLREEVKRLELTYQGQTLPAVTLSFGVAAAPGHGSAAQTLLRGADTALYRSKADGRDRVTVADAPTDFLLL